MQPKISICIPAYNRAHLLSDLLDSILTQDFDDYEIVICEDCSPERGDIKKIVDAYIAIHSGIIRYFENSKNIGYDGNLRNLFDKSNGLFCLFMGNDDLLCKNALNVVSSIIDKYENCGVIVRSYATFDCSPEKIKQTFRYFQNELELPAGALAIATAFRRSVVIPGMVIRRSSAIEVSSPVFDGTLLYQLYLVGLILARHSVIFTPEIIALRRDGIPPDFGNSEIEKGKFVPGDQTPESSISFMKGMLLIADFVEKQTKFKVYKLILSDIARYCYPILSIQATRPLNIFIKYVFELGKLGLWRSPFFYGYFFSLLFLGHARIDSFIIFIKNKLGYTPKLGKF